MNRRVWKFVLTRPAMTFQMPTGSVFVHVDEQNDTVCVWVLCDPHAYDVPRYLEAVNTDDPVPARGEHIGSVQMRSGVVWHVFALPEGATP